MKRERPGQIRLHRGFLKAEGKEALWPVEEVGRVVARDCRPPTPPTKS